MWKCEREKDAGNFFYKKDAARLISMTRTHSHLLNSSSLSMDWFASFHSNNLLDVSWPLCKNFLHSHSIWKYLYDWWLVHAEDTIHSLISSHKNYCAISFSIDRNRMFVQSESVSTSKKFFFWILVCTKVRRFCVNTNGMSHLFRTIYEQIKWMRENLNAFRSIQLL